MLNNIVNQNIADSASKLCEHCGQFVEAIEVNICGIVRKVQPVCQCEKDRVLAETHRIQKAKEDNELRALFSISNLGYKYLNVTFDDFIIREGMDKVHKITKHYALNFDEFGYESLLIWGDPGNGKTMLVAAVHNHLKQQGKTVVFITMPELLGKIKATFNRNNIESEEQIMKGLMACDLLIIDDLGAEKVSDWVQETIFRIIDGRVKCKKPILATSNLSIEQLDDKLGKRISDRLTEVSQPLENRATSYRVEIAKQRRGKFVDLIKDLQ